MLLNSMGVRLPGGLRPMELFWPAILILLGAWILFGSLLRGNIETEQASVDLQGAREARLRINHGAGELKVHSGAGAGELARGSFAGGLDQRVNKNGDRLEVRMKPARDFMDFPFFGPRVRLDWDVALNPDVPLALSIEAGANKSDVDLHELNVTDLKVETGASETKVTLPSHGRLHADFDLGAASLEIVVPEGVSARIRASVGAADLKIAESRFPHTGNIYQSPDFDSATNAVDMTIDAGAAQIRVR
jgi:hypothetical protein